MSSCRLWQLVLMVDGLDSGNLPSGADCDQLARWPGSLLISSLKIKGKQTLESYKDKLPLPKKTQPQSGPPSHFRQQINRWNGHITLWLLVGTLINVVAKLYTSHRYEEIQRLQYQKSHSQESAKHWQKLIWVVEKEHDFWQKFVSEARNCGHRRRVAEAKCQELYGQYQIAISQRSSDEPGRRWSWMGLWRYLLSFFQKIQVRQLEHTAQQTLDTCHLYDRWAERWERLELIGQEESTSAVSWKGESSRELFFHCQVPWTNVVINLWTAKHRDCEDVA